MGGAAFALFAPTLHHGFVNWDDDVYVTANPVIHPLTPDRVGWIFSHVYYFAYIPVTLLSHALDVAAWGFDPGGHHLTNVLLHAMNAIFVLLVGLLLVRARKGVTDSAALYGMTAAALLFAVHPLRAESVAWISDRKDLLCAFFLLPALGAYLRGWPVAALVLFILAALSKSVAVGFPLLLVLLDALWLKRKALVEKLPYAIVSLLLILVSLTQASNPKRPYALTGLTAAERALAPLQALGFALQKTLAPFALSPIVTRAGAATMAVAALVILAVSVLSILAWRRGRPAALLALASYLILLTPNLVGLRSGMQPVADRYSYVATIGFFLLAGGALAAAWRRGGAPRAIATCAVFALVLLFAREARAQSARWSSSIHLWESVVRNKPARRDFEDAYLNLGAAYAQEGRTADAEAEFQRVVALDPTNAGGWKDLGLMQYRRGARDRAAESFRRATLADPTDGAAFYNRAIVLDELGRTEEAMAAMKEAARLGDPEAREAMESLSGPR